MPLNSTLTELLRQTSAQGGESLFLVPDQPPRARVEGALVPLAEPLSSAQVDEIALALFGERRLERQAQDGSAGASFRLDSQVFGRATLSRACGAATIALRLRSGGSMLTLEEYGVPPVVDELLQASHGLLVVAGPHASGKTTTLCAMLDWINRRRPVHICTVEDPIAYELTPHQALIQQREVGSDVPDVASGIAAALDQDADVLGITALGELAALTSALHAAETGHLVLLQVHALDARQALTRLVEAVPGDLASLTRRTLSETLRGVVSQRLLARQPKGRVAVHEVLIPDPAFAAALASGEGLAGLPADPRSVDPLARIEALAAAGTVSATEAERARRAFSA